MCTVTIIIRENQTVITMNRDERIDRPAETAPQCWQDSNITAPMDGLAYGTWIGMNEAGAWACLLNSYDDYNGPTKKRSRGLLIPDILKQKNVKHPIDFVDLQSYAPFRFLVGNREEIFHYYWNGRELKYTPMPLQVDHIVTSSSWKADKVLPLREAAFKEWQKAGALFDAERRPIIHFWTGNDARSGIMMTRPHSYTTSVTQIILEGEEAQMNYWPRSELITHAV